MFLLILFVILVVSKFFKKLGVLNLFVFKFCVNLIVMLVLSLWDLIVVCYLLIWNLVFVILLLEFLNLFVDVVLENRWIFKRMIVIWRVNFKLFFLIVVNGVFFNIL